jgi:hypothetical protein
MLGSLTLLARAILAAEYGLLAALAFGIDVGGTDVFPADVGDVKGFVGLVTTDPDPMVRGDRLVSDTLESVSNPKGSVVGDLVDVVDEKPPPNKDVTSPTEPVPDEDPRPLDVVVLVGGRRLWMLPMVPDDD